MTKINLTTVLLAFILTVTACSTFHLSEFYHLGEARINGKEFNNSNDVTYLEKEEDVKHIWEFIQRKPIQFLTAEITKNNNPITLGWLKLAIIRQQSDNCYDKLLVGLQQWQQQYPNHPANVLLPSPQQVVELSKIHVPSKIAVLLPQSGPFVMQSRAIYRGLLRAYYKYNQHNVDKQTIAFYDTSGSKSIVDVYKQAVTEGAEVIVGPLTKDDVAILQRYNNFLVPTLMLNYNQASLLDNLTRNVYQFGLSLQYEIPQLATFIAQQHLHNALIISLDSSVGRRSTEVFTQKWQSLGGEVVDKIYLTPHADFNSAISLLLHTNQPASANLVSQYRRDFDVVLLFLPAEIGRQIVPLLKFYYSTDVPLYSSSAIYNRIPDPKQDLDLNGVQFTEIPWLIHLAHKSSEKNNIPKIAYDRLYALGHDCYILSNSLLLADKLTSFPLLGETGKLVFDNQRIYQKFELVTMKNGGII